MEGKISSHLTPSLSNSLGGSQRVLHQPPDPKFVVLTRLKGEKFGVSFDLRGAHTQDP